MIVADIGPGWVQVILAVVGLVGIIFNAIIVTHNGLRLRTPSKTKIGTQVEQANAVSAITLAHVIQLLRRANITPQTATDAVVTAEEAANGLANGEPLPKPRGAE